MPTVVAEPKNLNEISFEQRERDLRAQERAEQEELKRERNSPFSSSGFYQINKGKGTDVLSACIDENPKAVKLLLFIFQHMDKYNAVVCSYQVFQEALGISKATVQRAIKYLKDKGLIYIYKSGTSNVYVANPDVVWNSWGNNRQYCQFPANIVLSASEQEERAKVFDKRVQTVQVKE